MKYLNKSFEVAYGSQEYRDNWERVFNQQPTEDQVMLMKHATRWDTSFRLSSNDCAVNPKSPLYADWEDLTRKGYAAIYVINDPSPNYIYYQVTDKGIDYLKKLTNQG